MSLLALGLVLAAAGIHATWNLIVKRAGGGVAFVWLYGLTATALYAPIAIPILIRDWHSYGPLAWTFMTGSGLIHSFYFVLLQRAYRSGDLSVVYPLARGTGPMISFVAAMVLLGERPSGLAMAGAALICVSIFLFSRPGSTPVNGILFGAVIGILIATYTVWDKYAVTTLHVAPVAMEWVTSATRAMLLTPLALRAPVSLREEWANKRREALWIGFLHPLAYILVLFAMSFTALTYIAPAREVSILIGALLAAHFLGEQNRGPRIFAAGLMAAGVICLALG